METGGAGLWSILSFGPQCAPGRCGNASLDPSDSSSRVECMKPFQGVLIRSILLGPGQQPLAWE